MDLDYSVLALDGWLEFNRRKWGLRPVRLTLPENQRPAMEMVFYTDVKGRIRMPKRNPYMPVRFLPTNTESIPRLRRQWLSVSELAVGEFLRRGLVNSFTFPPSVLDVREWQWSGFSVGVRYSFYTDFSSSRSDSIDRSVRQKIRKAKKLGYSCERAYQLRDVLQCLEDTEIRQGFDHRLDLEDLELCESLLGTEVFRAYACYAPTGDVASARIILSRHGSSAIGWVFGTKREYLSSGCTQLLIAYSLADLQNSGATGFDWTGANIPSVAAAKSAWGCQLVPYYTIRQPNARSLASHLLQLWRFVKEHKR